MAVFQIRQSVARKNIARAESCQAMHPPAKRIHWCSDDLLFSSMITLSNRLNNAVGRKLDKNECINAQIYFLSIEAALKTFTK